MKSVIFKKMINRPKEIMQSLKKNVKDFLIRPHLIR